MTTSTDTDGLVERRFWLSLREPGCVPERKGPWPIEQTTKVLREFIAARPIAYIDYITVDSFGAPEVQHGPEVLQMADGRSTATGRKHNQRVREAEAQAARIAVLEGALDCAQTDLDLLRMAIEESDPQAELLIRVLDIWRRNDAALSGAV